MRPRAWVALLLAAFLVSCRAERSEPLTVGLEGSGEEAPNQVTIAEASTSEEGEERRFHGIVRLIDAETRTRMRGSSWRPGCPVAIRDLRLVRVTHWGFDRAVRWGSLVVHEDEAQAILGVMRELFRSRFPIQRMWLVDAYGADDDRSMEANNTSAFNCREATGNPGVWSQHAYGLAIDINPIQNPYVLGDTVLPPQGAAFADRSKEARGMIRPGSRVVHAFARIGWGWGGNWTSLQDYQHFSFSGR